MEILPKMLDKASYSIWCLRWYVRRAQMVWPMMTVTVTNFEGFTRQQFWILERKCPNSTFLQIFSKSLPSEALKICHSNCHHRPHHLSPSCGHTPFHTHIIWLFDDDKKQNLFSKRKPSKNTHLLMAYITRASRSTCTPRKYDWQY